jgi:hypothetical protein
MALACRRRRFGHSSMRVYCTRVEFPPAALMIWRARLVRVALSRSKKVVKEPAGCGGCSGCPAIIPAGPTPAAVAAVPADLSPLAAC